MHLELRSFVLVRLNNSDSMRSMASSNARSFLGEFIPAIKLRTRANTRTVVRHEEKLVKRLLSKPARLTLLAGLVPWLASQ
jgi:hypothetical protein